MRNCAEGPPRDPLAPINDAASQTRQVVKQLLRRGQAAVAVQFELLRGPAAGDYLFARLLAPVAMIDAFHGQLVNRGSG